MVRFLSFVAAVAAITASSSLAACSSSACIASSAVSPSCKSPEVPYYRDVFFIGGHDVESAELGNVTIDQLYVEKLTPVSGASKKPIVYFHGGGISGATILNTPDNRRGWASYFIEQGHEVYILDLASVGRSSENDFANFSTMATTNIASVEEYFSAPEDFDLYPQASLHTQFPGTGIQGDPVFDQFMASFLPISFDLANTEYVMRASGCEVLRQIGTPVYTLCHSLGCRQPLLISNDCPERFLGNINIEAAMTPFWEYNVGLGGIATSPWGFTNTPVTYDPPVADASELVVVAYGNDTLAKRNCYMQAEPARQLPKINSVPFMMITSEASVHATYDYCVIDYLKQTGGDPDWIQLADLGIHGNGHFMHLELNNLEIAAVVEDWIEKQESK
ncbi:Alpha/Beta hydrolase protein [Xylariales sp. PMI_506]|nr:Alpha/Beta hydrolase protein [Xylariales sp. PMI_506]